jgi:hypothetical protein
MCIAHPVFGYVYYCGSCRKKMGSGGEVKQCCPWCGIRIGHWSKSMGYMGWEPDSWLAKLPDQLPVFSERLSWSKTSEWFAVIPDQQCRMFLTLQEPA